MKGEHRFTLASNKAPKLDCPECHEKKHWQRYLDTHTGELLPEHYGKCDNADKCGAWKDPHKDGYIKAIWQRERGEDARFPETTHHQRGPQIVKTKAPTFIPGEVLTSTLQHYEENTFIQNLLHGVPFPFDVADVERVISLYYLGTIGKDEATRDYFRGAITLPFVDISGNVRAAQAKTFDVKNHTTDTNTLPYLLEKRHSAAGQPLPEWLADYRESESGFSCLYAEHLLNRYPHHTIALPEAPKTAIIGALYFGLPDTSNLIWLAAGSKGAFTFQRLQALRGRRVIIFPDLSKDGGTFAEWSAKAADFQKRMPGTLFTTFDLLELAATPKDREAGSDIADVLIKQDWRRYRNKFSLSSPPPEPTPTAPASPAFPEIPEPLAALVPTVETPTKPQPVLYPLTKGWQQELDELEAFFSEFELPDCPVKVGECETILNPDMYIPAAIILIRQHHGHRIYSYHLERLQRLRDKFTLAEDLAPTNGPQTANTTLLQL